jgi:hypothetical protein
MKIVHRFGCVECIDSRIPIGERAMLAVGIDRGIRDFGKSEPSDQSFGHGAFPNAARALGAGYESPGDRMFVRFVVFTHWDFLFGISFWISRRGQSDWIALLLKTGQPALQRVRGRPQPFELAR